MGILYNVGADDMMIKCICWELVGMLFVHTEL